MLNSKKQVSLAVLLGFLGGMTQSSFCYAKSERPLKSSANIVSQNKENFKNKEELENSKVNTQNNSNLSVTKLKKAVNSFGEFLFSTWERRLCTALALGSISALPYLVFRGIKNYNARFAVKEVTQDKIDDPNKISKSEATPKTKKDVSSGSNTEDTSENKDVLQNTENKEITSENKGDPNSASKTEATPKTENTNEENNIPQGTNTNSDVQKKGQPDTAQKILMWLIFSPWRCSPTISLVAKIFGFYENFNRLFDVVFCPDEMPKVKMSVLQFICFIHLLVRFVLGLMFGLLVPLLGTEVRTKLGKKRIIINVFRFLEPVAASVFDAVKGLRKGENLKDKIFKCLFYTMGFDFLDQDNPSVEAN